jgi:hypothetical protein
MRGRVARAPTLARDPVHYSSAAMRGQPVPEQDHRAVLLEFAQVAQELNQGFIVVGTRTPLEHEEGVTAIGFVHQRAGYGQPLPNESMAQHRIGATEARELRGAKAGLDAEQE